MTVYNTREKSKSHPFSLKNKNFQWNFPIKIKKSNHMNFETFLQFSLRLSSAVSVFQNNLKIIKHLESIIFEAFFQFFMFITYSLFFLFIKVVLV